MVVVGVRGRSELAAGITVELAVVEVTCTADATSLASEVAASEVIASVDEKSDDEDEAAVPIDAGPSTTLVPVDFGLFVVLCWCLCP